MLSARCDVCHEDHLLTSARTMSVHYNATGERCEGSVGLPWAGGAKPAADSGAVELPRAQSTVPAAAAPSLQLSRDHPPLSDRVSRCVVCRFMVPVTTAARLAPHRVVTSREGEAGGQLACRGSEQVAVPSRAEARQARARTQEQPQRRRAFAGERVLPEIDRDARRRVFEVAGRYGVSSAEALRVLKLIGEFVRGPQSSLPPGVARRLVSALEARGHVPAAHRALGLGGTRAERAGDLMQQLPRSMPALIDLFTAGAGPVATEAEELLRESAADGSLFLVPATHAHALAAATRTVSGLASDDLPSPAGVSLQPIVTPLGAGALWRVLSWREEAERLRLTSVEFTVHSIGDGPVLEVHGTAVEELRLDDDDSFSSGSAPLTGLGACLAAMLELVPVREPSGTAGAGTSSQRENTRHTSDSRVDHGVRLIYPTRSALGQGPSDGEAVSARIGRWSVRGHWRRQWYRSRQTHERIWIAEHEAGASDASVGQLRKVFIIAPRGSTRMR